MFINLFLVTTNKVILMVDAPASSSSGPAPTFLDNPKFLAGLSYMLGGVTAYGLGYGNLSAIISVILPLVIYFAKKDDAFVRFHAFQAFLWSGLLFVVGYIMGLVLLQSVTSAYYDPYGYYAGGGFGATFGLVGLFSFVGLVAIIVDLFLAIKAYNGDKIKLPVLGALAAKPFF